MLSDDESNTLSPREDSTSLLYGDRLSFNYLPTRGVETADIDDDIGPWNHKRRVSHQILRPVSVIPPSVRLNTLTPQKPKPKPREFIKEHRNIFFSEKPTLPKEGLKHPLRNKTVNRALNHISRVTSPLSRSKSMKSIHPIQYRVDGPPQNFIIPQKPFMSPIQEKSKSTYGKLSRGNSAGIKAYAKHLEGIGSSAPNRPDSRSRGTSGYNFSQQELKSDSTTVASRTQTPKEFCREMPSFKISVELSLRFNMPRPFKPRRFVLPKPQKEPNFIENWRKLASL